MTRKLLSAVALMVAVFFTGSLVAQAADITFGGQFRPRLEVWEQEGFNEDANANYFVNMRVRLNAKIKVDENTSAFIQMQTNTRWGSDP
ncbi:MAG: hypothetical protein IH923_12960, partial [Nitrospinae bacterium]|nr:hypothetical protein [Nitrospinota bacterium]